MLRHLILILALIGLPVSVQAVSTDIYAIQIGTYKHFANDIRKSVSQYGEVHVFTFKNLSRVTVGEFTSKEEALGLLERLKNNGFKDAFIRKTGNLDINKTHSTIEKFNLLISEMNAHAFYLDGYMYLFQGNGYVKIHRK